MPSNARSKATWQLGDRDIVVSNLDKPFWPEQAITKGELLEFYRGIASTLLPYLNDRPFMLETREGVNAAIGSHSNGVHIGRPRTVFVKDCSVVFISMGGQMIRN